MLPVPEAVPVAVLRARVGTGPAARLLIGPGSVGCATADAVAWRTPLPDDGVICLHGSGATRLLDAMLAHGLLLRAGDRVRLPAGAPAALPHVENWALLAASRAAAASGRVAGVPEGTAVPLVAAVMGGEVRPAAGHLGWYGIADGGRLLAVGEARTQNGFGYLARICVHPDARRRGLGAELTNAMTARLLRTHESVALGVRDDNPGARALYEGLGYRVAAGFSSYAFSS